MIAALKAAYPVYLLNHMAKIALISLYDMNALALRNISAALKRAGHKVSTIYLKP